MTLWLAGGVGESLPFSSGKASFVHQGRYDWRAGEAAGRMSICWQSDINFKVRVPAGS